MQLTWFTWLLSLLPVAVMLILMLGFRWGGMRAGAAAWLVTVVIAVAFFGASWQLIAWSQIKAILLALDVLTIVTFALLLYNMANETGAIKRIGQEVPRLTADRGLQVLMVGWLLVSFFQGMGGFGVPMAVCAPILVGMGYTPVKSMVIAAMGHNWSVTYGTMAAALMALVGVTGVAPETLAPYVGVLLGLTLIPTGMIIGVLSTGWKGMLHSLPAIIGVGGAIAIVHHLMGIWGLWTVATMAAVLVGGAVLILISRLPRYRAPAQAANKDPQAEKNDDTAAVKAGGKPRNFWVLVSPYLILMLLGFSAILITPLRQLLGSIRFTLQFPEIRTSLGWVTEAGPGKVFVLLSHPAAIGAYTCAITYLIYRAAGYLKRRDMPVIFRRTLHGLVDTSLAVIAMVGVATLMEHSGMTYLLSKGLSENLSRFLYPFIVPFTGVLGAVLTGSNNNSNVLFGVMHMETARIMGLSIPLILAAQSAGGSLGSVCAPAKVIVGCTTVGLSGQEGRVLQKLLPLMMIPTAIVGLAAVIWVYLIYQGVLP